MRITNVSLMTCRGVFPPPDPPLDVDDKALTSAKIKIVEESGS